MLCFSALFIAIDWLFSIGFSRQMWHKASLKIYFLNYHVCLKYNQWSSLMSSYQTFNWSSIIMNPSRPRLRARRIRKPPSPRRPQRRHTAALQVLYRRELLQTICQHLTIHEIFARLPSISRFHNAFLSSSYQQQLLYTCLSYDFGDIDVPQSIDKIPLYYTDWHFLCDKLKNSNDSQTFRSFERLMSLQKQSCLEHWIKQVKICIDTCLYGCDWHVFVCLWLTLACMAVIDTCWSKRQCRISKMIGHYITTFEYTTSSDLFINPNNWSCLLATRMDIGIDIQWFTLA